MAETARFELAGLLDPLAFQASALNQAQPRLRRSGFAARLKLAVNIVNDFVNLFIGHKVSSNSSLLDRQGDFLNVSSGKGDRFHADLTCFGCGFHNLEEQAEVESPTSAVRKQLLAS